MRHMQAECLTFPGINNIYERSAGESDKRVSRYGKYRDFWASRLITVEGFFKMEISSGRLYNFRPNDVQL